jgi:hypothetical protein
MKNTMTAINAQDFFAMQKDFVSLQDNRFAVVNGILIEVITIDEIKRVVFRYDTSGDINNASCVYDYPENDFIDAYACDDEDTAHDYFMQCIRAELY